ncbi:hypothetical protein ACFL5V_12205 [Fibrobacterota bacterium]
MANPQLDFIIPFFSDPANLLTVPTGQATTLVENANGRYNLTLKYGDVDALFSDGTKIKGRQERMMALGFFHGDIDGKDGPVTKGCWKYMREEFDAERKACLTDDGFNKMLKEKLQAIVQKDDGTRKVEADPLKNARIVFPGGFFITQDKHCSGSVAYRYKAESAAWRKNLGLGRIPLVVKVESRATGQPAAKVKVCFEMVSAFDPEADQKKYLTGISNASDDTSNPRSYIDGKLTLNDSGPFCYNCETGKGGRRPTEVMGSLFAKGKIHGFPHQITKKGRADKFSTVCETDDKGEAGVVFRPPRTAGDAFKIRVFVLRKTPKPDNKENLTTGLLTVWRNLRVSRIIEKPACGAFTGSPAPGPLGTARIGHLGVISTDFMIREYKKAFFDFILDSKAAKVTKLTAQTYKTAIEEARKKASNPRNYDLDKLIKTDINSPYLFWLEDPAAYNANKGAGKRTLNLTVVSGWTDMDTIISSLTNEFLKYWTINAHPGVTIVRAELGEPYSYMGHPNQPNRFFMTTSGLATRMRGCYLWYSLSFYNNNMPYPLTVNTLHEVGHVLYFRHHYTSGSAGSETGGFPADHDRDDYCLMGYLRTPSKDHCGKCLLKLRGWNERKI